MAREIHGVTTENPRKMLDTLAEFAELDAIEYRDLGNGEDYILRKGAKSITLKMRGGMYQGGFMTIDYGQPPLRH